MSNVHGLFSRRNDDNDSDKEEDGNNRFVGGIDSRGGGSGLAVEPNPGSGDGGPGNVSDNILAQASQQSSSDDQVTRRITMYRSGFVVDDGPYRRLDDPNNSEFLRDLARGITPRELTREMAENGQTNGDVVVGLVDKRTMEYEDDKAEAGFASFSGAGQSLGGGGGGSSNTEATSTDSSGVFSPGATSASTPPEVDASRPTTIMQIRLLNGKRLKVKVNADSPVSVIGQHIDASGDGGDSDYVLSSGYPPAVLKDLTMSVEDAGLKGAQIMQKKP